ncbi:hypothetical protein DsansV1_C23g0178861 [Dioscorea sansibarensis]
MKRTGVVVAAASSATLLAASACSASSPALFSDPRSRSPSQDHEKIHGEKQHSMTERYSPRFDGLRFIETLVTAHR